MLKNLHHFGFFKLLIHVFAHAGERTPQRKSEDKENCKEKQEQQYIDKILIAVQTRDRLAHCVYRVGEGEQQIYLLEEVGQKLNGIGAAGACNLNDHNNDGEHLADIAEDNGKAVGYHRAGKRGDRARENEQSGMQTADAENKYIADGDYKSLRLTDEEEKQVPAEVFLSVSGSCQLDRRVDLHDHVYHDAAYPNRKDSVEGRHTRAV